MCTLVAFHRCIGDRPLVVAANRDEYLDRPAEGPALRPGGILAPRDLREGGSWLGLNRHGLFVGLTNRPAAQRDSSRSRGLLLLDVLAAEGAAKAAAALEGLTPQVYNPFNLLVADGRDAFVAVYEERPSVRRLEPGVHVIGNADPDDRRPPKLARLWLEASRAAELPGEGVLDALASLCRVHRGGASPFEDTCIHAGGYGTRSSTLLCLGDDPRLDALRHADGPPCTTPYRDLTHLLRDLGPARLAPEARATREAR